MKPGPMAAPVWTIRPTCRLRQPGDVTVTPTPPTWVASGWT